MDEYNKFEFKLPLTTFELYKWGQQLHNYVYFYQNIILENSGAILGIFEKDKLRYCLHLDNDLQIVQARGKYNANILQDD